MIKTRILVDCHVFDGSFQGTTTYLKGIYTEMLKQTNIEFYFATHDVRNLIKIFGKHQNVTYLQYKTNNKYFRLLVEIPTLIKYYKIDIAHFQYIVPPIKFCKYITTVHDVLFLDYPYYFPFAYKLKNNFLFRYSAKISELVLTVSEFSKERIEYHFKIKNVIVTPNAVDKVYYQNYPKLEVINRIKTNYRIDNYFLYVSRLEPRKNHLTLLKVFVENKYYTNYNLVFIGADSIVDKYYKNYLAKLPTEIKNKIHHLKNINFDNLLTFVRAASLSIYPSVAEGFGIPPLESIAAQIPTICSNSTAMSDFKFMSKYLFDPLDTNDLKAKIDLAINKPYEISVEEMQNKYNWKSTAQSFLSAIETIMK